MLTTATRGMATMFGNAAAKEATCHSDDRRCDAGTKSLPQSCIDSNPTPIVTRLNTTTNTVSLSSCTEIDAPVVETIRDGIMTAAESREMRVIASLLNMGRSRGRFAAVAPMAATITSLATTPKARSSTSASIIAPICAFYCASEMRSRGDGVWAFAVLGETGQCSNGKGCCCCNRCKFRHRVQDQAPVSYCRQRGSVCAAPRHCELCTEQIERFEKVASYLARAAHSVPSDGCCPGPYALQDVRVRPFQQLRSWTRAAHRDR